MPQSIRFAVAVVATLVSFAGGSFMTLNATVRDLPTAAAQAPAPAPVPPEMRPGSIRGLLVRQDDGAPLSRAQISVSGPTPISTMTDRNGRFEMTGLTAGRYTMTAGKSGFVTLQYGQRSPGEQVRPIEVADGEAVEDIRLALPRGGAVAGRVIDERGEPVTNAIVQILRQQFVRGKRQAVSLDGAVDRTDDRGEFRLHGIPPGNYLLSASLPPPERRHPIPVVTVGSATTFYPGTPSEAQAQPLTIGGGQDLSGLLLTMVSARMATISGVVHGADGRPVGQASIGLWQRPAFSAASGWGMQGGRIGPNGTFSFPNLPPGEYTLVAQVAVMSPGTVTGPEIRGVAAAHIVLDGSDVAVPLTLGEGDTASGRITFDPSSRRTTLARTSVRITFDAADPAQTFPPSDSALIDAGWTFELGGLIGRRRLRVDVPEDWTVKSVRIGNTDITDTPLEFSGSDIGDIEVVLTDRLTEVSGIVTDAEGDIAPDATIVLFADDPTKWMPESRYVVAARPAQNGRFQHRGLPPGRYMAVALESLDAGEETNPETLERLRKVGTSFTLEEGGRVGSDLESMDFSRPDPAR